MCEALRELGNLPEGAVSRPQEHDRAAEAIGVRYPEGPLYHSTKQHSGMKRLTNRKTEKSRQLWVQCFFRD